jgi:hypothetical protein
LNRSERERRAREIIADAQVDTAQYFNRVVKQQVGVTFKEQAKIWLEQSQTRNRKPIRATTVPTIQAGLDKWILPEVGHLPLYETAKYPTMKALVTRMNAGRLSAQTVNSYFRMAVAVITSAEMRTATHSILKNGCKQTGPSSRGNLVANGRLRWSFGLSCMLAGDVIH